MIKTLSEATSASIREAIDRVTADKNKIPGLVATVVGKDGKLLFSHASGTRGKETQEPSRLFFPGDSCPVVRASQVLRHVSIAFTLERYFVLLVFVHKEKC